jgi:hypothetical protein
MKYYYFGGPLDGGEVEAYMTPQDYLLIQHGKTNNNSVTYYYTKCDEHPYFEFAGEVQEEEDE